MHVPAERERIVIAGRPGQFIVVTVDQERLRADVISLTGKAYLEENVPFSVIQPYTKKHPRETE